MSKFKVDNEQIDATVETLKTLLTKCEELYDKEVPFSDVDKGQTHEELISVCDNIRTTCYYFGQLISNTIEFLGKSSEMFKQSDKNSANAIKSEVSGSRDGSGKVDIGSSSQEKTVEINSYSVGVNKGNITYVNQNNAYANDNGWGAYSGYSNGECGYASQIMALSYVGIGVSPEELCRREYANHEIHTFWGAEANYGYNVDVVTGSEGLTVHQNLTNMVTDYKNDAGRGAVSPVPIHYVQGNQMHSVLLTDYDPSTNTFTALDPWSDDNTPTVRTITIEENGRISNGGGAAWTGSGQAYIDGYVQYK